MSRTKQIGWVVIGRNEGLRLQKCMASIDAVAKVYVDSGSTDDSVARAWQAGFQVVSLDLRIPFTAARARNEGWRRLLEIAPSIDFIMFVDGDCEVLPEWAEQAVEFLDTEPSVGIVCGRRRERFPSASFYNYLCDLEWNTPVGKASACGGDALFRRSVLIETQGYRAEMIAGEEPELCIRAAQLNWQIWRINVDMTLHDSAMIHFSQWFNRTKRAGYAFAHGYWLHRNQPVKLWERELASIFFWTTGIPFLTLLLVLFTGSLGLLALLVYPLQTYKLMRRFGKQAPHAFKRAMLNVFGKFAEAIGAYRFFADLLRGVRSKIIEYK